MAERIICTNRSAGFDYFIVDRIEAGIVLEGTEVKSLRKGNVNLKDSFCFIRNGEVLIKNMHIAVYDKSGAFNSKDAKRDRKLLLHKAEIRKVGSKVNEQGMTLVPLKMYFKQALVKMELGLCKGKHTFDKKRSLMEKDIIRDAERSIKNYR